MLVHSHELHGIVPLDNERFLSVGSSKILALRLTGDGSLEMHAAQPADVVAEAVECVRS